MQAEITTLNALPIDHLLQQWIYGYTKPSRRTDDRDTIRTADSIQRSQVPDTLFQYNNSVVVCLAGWSGADNNAGIQGG